MNQYSCIYFDVDTEHNTTNENNSVQSKVINRIVEKDFFIENEIYISNYIKNIFFYRKYFFIPIKSQHLHLINIADEDNEDNSHDYQIILDGRMKTPSNKIILQYENVQFKSFKNYLFLISQSHKNIFFIQQLFYIYEKILQSIQILISNNIFHNHLIDENILFKYSNSIHHFPIISNFSFSIKINSSISNTIKHFLLDYDPSYIQWPIELHTLAFINKRKLISISIGNINEIVSDLANNNFIFENFNDSVKNKFITDGINYLKKYINCKYDTILNDALSYWSTWDNHALSAMYLPIIINLHKKIKHHSGKNITFCTSFMKLLLKNMSYNPANRLSIIDNLLQFNTLINNISKNEYKELLDSL